MSAMSAGALLGTVGFTTALLPSMSGVNLVYGAIIAWLLSIPQVIVYKMMSTRISRSGGDYVWVSRVFGGYFGGPIALTGYVFETFAYAGLITLAAVFSIGAVGTFFGYQNMLSLALPGNVAGSDPTLQFLIGALLFVILVAINIIRPKTGFKIVSVLTIVGVLQPWLVSWSLSAQDGRA